MTSLAQHHSNTLVKLLSIGDSGAGKTGSLVSLVKAGFKLRILDLDNKLDVLRQYVLRDCPELISNVDFRTIRDKYKATAQGMVIDGQPKAFIDAIRMFDKWKYIGDDGEEIDLGSPAVWGADTILVIDSLSRFCDSAYDWAAAMAGAKADGRAIYGTAQDAVESTLAGLTSASFNTNLIVIAHISYMEMPDGTRKCQPQGVGQKLSPKIPSYFGSYVLYENKNGKRTIRTSSTPMVDLFNPAPFILEGNYPLETGLATIFEALKGEQCQDTTTMTKTTSAPILPSRQMVAGIGNRK